VNKPVIIKNIHTGNNLPADLVYDKDCLFSMNKKLTSTLLLFAVGVGFLWWGLAMLFGPKQDPGEETVYALMILGCSIYAFVSLLMLPRKRQS
jgi:hypothetical protein